MKKDFSDTELPDLCALVADLIDAQVAAEESGDPDAEGQAIRLLNRLMALSPATIRTDLAAVLGAPLSQGRVTQEGSRAD